MLAYTKLYYFIPVYILKVFTEKFVCISFACWFKLYFIPESMAILFSGCWQYFLIYRVIKYIFKSSFVKTLYISTKWNKIHNRTIPTFWWILSKIVEGKTSKIYIYFLAWGRKVNKTNKIIMTSYFTFSLGHLYTLLHEIVSVQWVTGWTFKLIEAHY